MNAPTKAPVRKIASVGIAGALATLLVWALSTFVHLDISANVATALVAVVLFAVGYMVPAAASDVVPSAPPTA